MVKVSVVKGNDRKENIKRAIQLISEDIQKAIKLKKSEQLFIKINAIDTNFPLACTHIDALKSVLEVFYDKFDKIIIGDNSFAFTKNKGGPYHNILIDFPKVILSDLKEFESEVIEFKKLNGTIVQGKVSLLPKKSFTISLALPKTHDTFVYTGCLKNMFGCVIQNRGAMHALSLNQRLLINNYVQSNKIKWNNLINVIKKTKPDLCIMDAYEGMDGNGPLFGNKIKLGIAICSLNGLALDKLTSKICGLDYVPYLSLLTNIRNMQIIKEGFNDINEIIKKFKQHYNHKYQIKTSIKSFIPLFDLKLIISLLKRSYRLKDKLLEKIGG